MTGWKIDIKSQSQAAELMGIELDIPQEDNMADPYGYYTYEEPEAFYMESPQMDNDFYQPDDDTQ